MEPPPCQPKQYKATRSPAHCRPLVTMKAVLLTLLAVSLALRPGETSATMGPGHGNRAGGGGDNQGRPEGHSERGPTQKDRERRWRWGDGGREVRWKVREAAAGRRGLGPCRCPPLGQL